jgi:histidyl-tRNA synthetase
MVKEKKLKPSKELPLGFIDRQERELILRDFVISNIKGVMRKYGFQYLETPSFEYTDSIGKFLPDKDRPDQGVFSFKDGKNWLSLRYDLTAPLARYVAKNYLEIPKPFKRYQIGTVWRNEKPGVGRYREFLQFDADYVGTKNLQADAELCVLISEILEGCGLSKSEYTVKISSRKFTKELLNELKINSAEQSSITLRALDKLDRLGWTEVKKLLGKGRKDKSGDFTKGANLNDKQIELLEKKMKDSTPITQDVLEIMKIFEYYKFSNFIYDPSIIRGLEYYTGIIFEVYLNMEFSDSKGKSFQFGAIGGGGRYDNLVSNFGNFDCPATGISIGIDRLIYVLLAKRGGAPDAFWTSKPVVVCVLNKSNFQTYVDITKKLRSSNINAEIYPGEGKLKKQMEYANKIGSPAVILYGDDEKKIGKVTLRNLETGKENSIGIDNLTNEIKKLL